MRHLRLIPDDTKIPFMGTHRVWMVISTILLSGAVVLLFTKELNFGIDFKIGRAHV